jgi:hypothetical protein
MKTKCVCIMYVYIYIYIYMYMYQRMYICANVDINLTRYVFIPCDIQQRRVEKGVEAFTIHGLKISERRQH